MKDKLLVNPTMLLGLMFIAPAIGLIQGCAPAEDVPLVDDVPTAAMWGSHTLFYVHGIPISSDEFSWHYALAVDWIAAEAERLPELNATLAAGPPKDPSRNRDAWIKYNFAKEDKSRYELYQEYGAEVTVLAILISAYGSSTYALADGHEVPEEEVLWQLEAARENYKLYKTDPEGHLRKIDPEGLYGKTLKERYDAITLFIDRVGEDRYWQEIRPRQMERDHTNATYRPSTKPANIEEIERVHKAIYEDLDVEFTADWDSDATAEQAFEYNRKSHLIMIEYLSSAKDQ